MQNELEKTESELQSKSLFIGVQLHFGPVLLFSRWTSDARHLLKFASTCVFAGQPSRSQPVYKSP